jgi:(E)-4-hydroxy-3-methylbut-2-enyl-diphosphate synthase
VARLEAEGSDWNYPLHLGVTEAGDGEDGRIKSAIGIGSLLADGIGDTIRVSLTEDAVYEVPVAQALVRAIPQGGCETGMKETWNSFEYERRKSKVQRVAGLSLGGTELMRVFTSRKKWDSVAHKIDQMGDFKPEIISEDSGVVELDPRETR